MSNWGGNLIYLARRGANLSQRELAMRAKTSQAAIAAYESGKRSPTLETLARIVGAADQELRIRLAPLDDHDGWIKRYEATLPPEVIAEWQRQDQDLLRQAGTEAAQRRNKAASRQ